MAHEHQSTREEIFQGTTFETHNIKQKAYENMRTTKLLVKVFFN